MSYPPFPHSPLLDNIYYHTHTCYSPPQIPGSRCCCGVVPLVCCGVVTFDVLYPLFALWFGLFGGGPPSPSPFPHLCLYPPFPHLPSPLPTLLPPSPCPPWWLVVVVVPWVVVVFPLPPPPSPLRARCCGVPFDSLLHVPPFGRLITPFPTPDIGSCVCGCGC